MRLRVHAPPPRCLPVSLLFVSYLPCLFVFANGLCRRQDGHYKEVYGISFQSVSTKGGAGLGAACVQLTCAEYLNIDRVAPLACRSLCS